MPFVLTPLLILRRPGNGSDGEPYLDTSSEGSSGSEGERLARDRPSVGTSTSSGREASGSSILPIFEYLESDPPYGREPLADKVRKHLASESVISYVQI